MNEQTYAGLSDSEANEALCAWLNERTNVLLQSSRKRFLERHTSNGYEFVEWFTCSHDSIHRVLDVMNEEERFAYMDNILYLFADSTATGAYMLALLASPAQKCEAALRALGLGKEEANA